MIKIIAFDAFGTLFNFDPKLISHTESPALADILNYARRKQLEYTWLHSLKGTYLPFDKITLEVLEDAVRMYGGEEGLVEQLATLYTEPVCFEDVKKGLDSLASFPIKKGILSNGTVAMLESGIEKNNLSAYLDFVLSADTIGVYKPAAKVYQLVLDAFSVEKEEVLFVSSNQWDVAGAAEFGFHCVWLNRTKEKMESLLKMTRFAEMDSMIALSASALFLSGNLDI